MIFEEPQANYIDNSMVVNPVFVRVCRNRLIEFTSEVNILK